MANDFYINEQEGEAEDWNLLEQEFHEWQVLNDVVALVETKGLSWVLLTILNKMEEQSIK